MFVLNEKKKRIFQILSVEPAFLPCNQKRFLFYTKVSKKNGSIERIAPT
jgi:hypothetical protein